MLVGLPSDAFNHFKLHIGIGGGGGKLQRRGDVNNAVVIALAKKIGEEKG